jgi:hypothetical protein
LDPISGVLIICPFPIIPEETVWYDLIGVGGVIVFTSDGVEFTFAVSLVEGELTFVL